ncbi:MAG: hypothetical protein WBB88_04475 [Methyloceanibacter sp.]
MVTLPRPLRPSTTGRWLPSADIAIDLALVHVQAVPSGRKAFDLDKNPR